MVGSRSLSAMTDATPPPDDGGAGNPPTGTPPGNGTPNGYANVDDRTWALIAHFGGAALALISLGPAAFIVPLIAYLATRRESPVAQAHARAALNFQIGAGVVIGGLLWLLQLAVAAIGTIFGVFAGIKANEGGLYAYPLNFKIVK
jgi:uncharacterized Tic20 family protein